MGAASLAVAVALGPVPVGPATQFLVVLLGAAPLVVALLAGSRHRRVLGTVTGTAGVLLVVVGVWTTAASGSLQLLTMDVPVLDVLTNAASTLAPPALVATGLLLVLAGLAGRLGDRVLGGTAAVDAVLFGLVVSAALFARAFWTLSYLNGAVQRAPLVAAAVTGTASVLLIVVVTRWWSVAAPTTPGPAAAPAVTVPGSARRGLARWGALALLVVVVATAALWSRNRISDRLDLGTLFADPALAGCVASAMGGPADGQVSERELSGVTQLDCVGGSGTGAQISTLTGIDNLPDLSGLSLGANAISDLGPLTGLPELRSLAVTDNAVSDLGPLAGLPYLADLGLSGNRISDLTPLAGLTSLRHLGLAGNQIGDLSPLAGLTQLEDVDLYGNQVTDVAPLAGLAALDHVGLVANQVTDPSPLCRLPRLTHLDLTANQVRDAGTLTGCPAVEQLSLGGNPLVDLTPLRQLPSLLGVDLSETDPTGLTGVEELRAAGVYVGGLA